jgi:serine/threonine protein kinase
MPEWIGKTVGKVRIDQLLARGGMAEVYLGTHLTLERPVAVKLLHSYIEEDPFLLERFHREAKVVASLRHPNIVQIFDFDTIDGHPYIVMEFLRGPTLATYLRHLHQRKKRLPPNQVARFLSGLTDAIDYAHSQGVIHRDIKPSNILLHNKTDEIPLDKPLPNDAEAIVTDFGLVRVVDAASQTVSGLISGTPAYMSPEQARGDQIDHRTDIYSLGVVLYEMLAGRVPFEADNTVTILHMHIHTPPPPIPGIPAKVQAVMDRALLKNPNDRYQSSLEMAEDFLASIGLGTPAEVVGKPEPVNDTPTSIPVEVPAPLPQIPGAWRESRVKMEQASTPKPEPRQEPEKRREPEPSRKPEPAPRPEPKSEPKPARGRSKVPVLLFSVLGLLAVTVGGYVIISKWRQTPPVSTAPASTQEIPNTGIIPSPSPAPALPSPEGMVPVPAGSYWVGLSQPDQFHVAPKSIALESYWIDQYETTNEQYQKYMSETGAEAPLVALGAANFPVRGVNFEQAKAYCQWLKKRLPKEAEWEAAGRGPGENPRIYPTEDPTFPLKFPDDLYGVGTLANNVSPFKVYDLIGNVWEWVDDPYDPVPPDKNVLRGGRYSLPQDLAYRYLIAPDNSNVQYAGFRCAASEVSQ